WKSRAEGPGDEKRQRGADQETEQRAETGQYQHLRQIDGENARARRPQRLKRGDHLAAAIEMTRDGIGYADSSNQQRREPDQGEILSEALEILLQRRRRIGP